LPAQALAGRRIVVAPPLPFPRTGKLRYVGFLKRLVSRLVSNIVPSESMAREFPRSIVIPNPFDQSAFFQTNLSAAGTVLFAGRLVEGKGCGILLEAFARAALAHPAATLTIAGDGPERQMLETMASRLGIKDRVRFLGDLRSADIAGTMREHRVMVVPSLEEAFGIVALEGLASGCRLIVAETGGLPEAVGPCALRFPRGDAGALAACIERALGPDDIPPPRAEVAAHLERFTPRLIAEQYLAVLGSGQ
jgi:glycosyltransferase involved in cell wall biosynthesis